MYIACYAGHYFVLGEQEQLHLVVQLGKFSLSVCCIHKIEGCRDRSAKSEARKHPCRDAMHKIEDVGRVMDDIVIYILLFAHAQNRINWFM